MNAIINVRLKEVSKISNIPIEKAGIIDDPKLIAIGQNNTLNAAGLLIEYGFIYEKKFTDAKSRGRAIEDLTLKTYEGLGDYMLKNQ